jgi:hypothetical protein
VSPRKEKNRTTGGACGQPHRRAGSLLAVAALLLGLRAPGQANDKPDEASLVAQAVALRLQGRDQEAFDLLARAWQTYPTPRVEAQLGLAAQALGQWVLAEKHLSEALLANQDDWIAHRRKVLEQSLLVVRRKVGTLEVLANVSGASLLIDGQGAARLPLRAPLRLPAGTVVVQVQSPGYLPVQRPVTITGGQLARENVLLVPLPVPLPTPRAAAAPARAPALAVQAERPPPPRSDRRNRRILYALLGTAAAGAGLSLWSGLDTLSARDRYRTDPTASGYQDGLGRQRRTNLLLIGTGVVSAVAALWSVVGHRGAP